MTKEELKDKILELLNNETIGITITRIADLSHVSRPTIYKYLGLLQNEGLVEEIDVGGSKFWTTKNSKNSKSSLISSIISPYRYFIDIMLETVDNHFSKKKPLDWKKIGFDMSKSIDLERLFETEVFYQIFEEQQIIPKIIGGNFDPKKENRSKDNHLQLLKRFSPFFEKIFKFVFAFLDDCVIEPPFELEDPVFLIVRLKNFKLLKDDRIIYILSGLSEGFFNRLFVGLNFEIIPSIDIDKKTIILKIHFFVDSPNLK